MRRRGMQVTNRALYALMLPLIFFGCASLKDAPNLGGIYNQAAQGTSHNRNPVIVIPGILGSRLVDEPTDRLVWGAFSGDFADPGKPDGARLVSVPMQEGRPLDQLIDTTKPDGVLDTLSVSILGLNIQLKAYLNILGMLGVGGYRDQDFGTAGIIDYGPGHFTCFQFAYDWRRDNAENARLLGVQIEEAARIAQEGMNLDEPPRVDVVAHSMGGLVLRYYLRYGDQPLPDDGSLPELTWAGAEHVQNAILVATPNAGSAQALMELVDGLRFSIFLPKYEPAILGTMPGIYQLLPRPRHGAFVDSSTGKALGDELYDVEFWSRMQWGLADPRQDAVLRQLLPDTKSAADRRRIALDHLDKCLRQAKQFHAAIDVKATPPPWLRLHLFAGDAEPTPSVLSIDTETGKVKVLETAPGDGTVARYSTLMDERTGGAWVPRVQTPIAWHGVQFIFRDHLGLTKDPQFTDNVLYLLLEQPRSADHAASSP